MSISSFLKFGYCHINDRFQQPKEVKYTNMSDKADWRLRGFIQAKYRLPSFKGHVSNTSMECWYPECRSVMLLPATVQATCIKSVSVCVYACIFITNIRLC